MHVDYNKRIVPIVYVVPFSQYFSQLIFFVIPQWLIILVDHYTSESLVGQPQSSLLV